MGQNKSGYCMASHNHGVTSAQHKPLANQRTPRQDSDVTTHQTITITRHTSESPQFTPTSRHHATSSRHHSETGHTAAQIKTEQYSKARQTHPIATHYTTWHHDKSLQLTSRHFTTVLEVTSGHDTPLLDVISSHTRSDKTISVLDVTTNQITHTTSLGINFATSLHFNESQRIRN